MRLLLDVSAVPDRPVGAGVYTLALAEGLATHPDVDLVLLARAGDRRWDTPAIAPARRPARLVWEQLRGPAVARELHADVWHGPHYTLPLRATTPTAVTVHDLTFFEHPEWHERAKVMYFRRMMKAAVARADVVICVSDDTASRLRVHCDPRGDVVIIPHGVDHTRFTQHTAADDLARLAEHGINPPYIAFSGTVEPRKDLPTLVRAFARIAPSRPELRLVLGGGDGWGTAELRDAVAASGVATHIVRPGYLDDATLAALFRHADVVAYPSFAEGFGLPALEALACGRPLVTTRGSAIEEVVGDAAVLVQPHDTDALALALRSVLDDPQLQSRLQEAGPQRAATYTWQRSVDAHVAAYKTAAKARA